MQGLQQLIQVGKTSNYLLKTPTLILESYPLKEIKHTKKRNSFLKKVQSLKWFKLSYKHQGFGV